MRGPATSPNGWGRCSGRVRCDLLLIAIPHSQLLEVMFFPGLTRGWAPSLYPLVMVGGYGSLLLGILLGGSVIKTIFEFPLLRFIGLISYSLYMWHLPVINHSFPFLSHLALKVEVLAAVLVAYRSYQIIERRFLLPRHRNSRLGKTKGDEQPESGLLGEDAGLSAVAAPPRA
jgi:peptidoglycan/LPS O-acetylase OafA/YrhL